MTHIILSDKNKHDLLLLYSYSIDTILSSYEISIAQYQNIKPCLK